MTSFVTQASLSMQSQPRAVKSVSAGSSGAIAVAFAPWTALVCNSTVPLSRRKVTVWEPANAREAQRARERNRQRACVFMEIALR